MTSSETVREILRSLNTALLINTWRRLRNG